jgi:hypothetical protein
MREFELDHLERWEGFYWKKNELDAVAMRTIKLVEGQACLPPA